MPVDWSKYPPDWKELALAVKRQSDWACEGCQTQCRRPGEPFVTHKLTLTVAHINHIEHDCRPENLVALCAPCHLRYDGERRRLQKLARARIQKVKTAIAERPDPQHLSGPAGAACPAPALQSLKHAQ